MLKNYFKTAWRNILKNRMTSFINIFGLAIGISCSLLIWLWVRDETSYNQYIPDADRVYQVLVNVPFNGDTITQDAGPGPLQPAIQNTVPEVEAVTKTGYSPDLLFSAGDKSIKEKGSYVTDDFFRVFRLRTLDGNADRAIRNIDQVVITRKIAEKYFNTAFAAGKRIKIDNKKEYVVGAVIEDLPHNSTLQFDWLINFKVNEQDWMKTWGNISFPTYLKLKLNTSAASAAAVMRSIYAANAPEGFKHNYPILQPVKNIYLHSNYENGKVTGGRIGYVRIFALVAIFILLIACINFMNLATARASLRAKEIGIRKVSGAGRGSLIKQFITESILICMFATAVAVFIVWTFLPAFNTLFDKQIHLAASAPSLWIAVIVLVVMTAIIAGSYPALLLSSLKPVKILKGDRFIAGANTNAVRKGLVVFQFALSTFLVVGTLVVSKQMLFIQTKNLGFDKEHLMYIHLDGELSTRVETYQNELNKLPGVVASCPINSLPMNLMSASSDLSWTGKPNNFQSNTTATWVGYGFARSMGIPLTAGRDFSQDYPGDSTNYVINESAAKMMNMKNPVGQQVSFWNGKGTIIGVLQDFHMASVHSPINPLILTLAPGNTEFMMVRLNAGNLRQTIARVGRLTRSFNPEYPYEYHFADEAYETMYKSETQVSALMKYFGILAVIISCLGLFGMVTFSTGRRYKEIGIRKVLGASAGSIVGLLSEESLKMIVIAMLVAFPLAYWASADWLATFHYKISLGIGIFLLAAALLLLVSLATISFQSMKAALSNPADSLRTE